jgi:excisionase family DNA binding protein
MRISPKPGDESVRPHKVAFSINEVVELTGLGRSSIYEAIASGELCARKRGGRTLILAADLDAWLQELKRIAPQKTRPS